MNRKRESSLKGSVQQFCIHERPPYLPFIISNVLDEDCSSSVVLVAGQLQAEVGDVLVSVHEPTQRQRRIFPRSKT